MIDKQIIDSAKIIRKEYLETTKNVQDYESDLKRLVKFLKEKMENLEKLKNIQLKKGKEQEQVDNIFADVLKELNSIEEEEKRLSNKIKKMNESLDKLKRDELALYTTIKERYPKLSDDQIKKEIHKYLEK